MSPRRWTWACPERLTTLPHDPHLADELRRALAGRAGIKEQAMFGGYCWLLNGNMLCGVEVGRFMFRVGKDLEAEALSRPGARPMDITGKPMRGFVWVDANDAMRDGLKRWLDLATRYVGTLAVK